MHIRRCSQWPPWTYIHQHNIPYNLPRHIIHPPRNSKFTHKQHRYRSRNHRTYPYPHLIHHCLSRSQPHLANYPQSNCRSNRVKCPQALYQQRHANLHRHRNRFNYLTFLHVHKYYAKRQSTTPTSIMIQFLMSLQHS